MPFTYDRDRCFEDILNAMPCTRPQMEYVTGLSIMTVRRRLNELHAAQWCHISAWARPKENNGGRFVPVYKAGPGRDMPCRLKPQTMAESQKKYRDAARKDGRWLDRSARIRARYHADKAAVGGDPLVNALFGKAKAQQPMKSKQKGWR